MANSDKVLGQVMQDAVEEKIDVSRKLKVGIIAEQVFLPVNWSVSAVVSSSGAKPGIQRISTAKPYGDATRSTRAQSDAKHRILPRTRSVIGSSAHTISS